jgi:hypothetical protein
MKEQADRPRQVVILSDYKKRKEMGKTSGRKDPAKILDEVSYYLLMAAKAMQSKQ